MSKFKGNKGKKGRPRVGDKAKEVLEGMDETNPVITMFRAYSSQLDAKHDKYERIVKLSRDITIESKRIIFSLHGVHTDIEEKRHQVLDDANSRLRALIGNNFKSIAAELRDEDPHQYHKAYAPGLQEFIEAFAFCSFIKDEDVDPWTGLDDLFAYDDDGAEFKLLVPQQDYILGIADFTGELMRRCINTLGVGNVSECFKLTNFVRHVNTGFLSIIAGSKEVSRKAYVLRQSLTKMELVCYNIQIRGSEVPKHMLLSVIENSEIDNEQDEGFY